MREVCAEFLGEVTEWPNVRDWKSRVGQKPTGGSNPPASAPKGLSKKSDSPFCYCLFR